MKIQRNTEDKQFLQEVEEAIKNNDGYCCCKLEKIPENKCICKQFMEQQYLGPCECGRYIKIEIDS